MAENDYPRLCGGTFFTLVLQCLKQRSRAREHIKGESDGLNNGNVLAGLISVINPDYAPPNKDLMKTRANSFKSCTISTGEYLPFGDTTEIKEFNRTVHESYLQARFKMEEFVNDFLAVGESPKKECRLVKGLVDLVLQDESIEENAVFLIGEHGEQYSKGAMRDLRSFCLPSLLLGIWHYVVVSRQDNTVGKATYDQWCPPRGQSVRQYVGTMGEQLLYDIDVYMPTHVSDGPTEAEYVEAEIVDDPTGHASTDKTPHTTVQQVINQNPVFNTFNFNSSVGTFINHVDNYHGGEPDEQ